MEAVIFINSLIDLFSSKVCSRSEKTIILVVSD